MPGPFDSVLLLAFGGPERPDDIRPFLDNVLRGRSIPSVRIEEVVQHYLEVGGSSPLNRLTAQQAEGLRSVLRRDGPDLPVFVGMRHWHPYVADTLAVMAGGGHRRAIGLVLAAHPSDASRDAYVRTVAEARRRLGATAPEVEFTPPFFEHPLFIEALSARLKSAHEEVPAERRPAAAVLLTAHSIPVAMSEASGYEASLRRTATLLAAASGIASGRLIYQSRSGNPAEPWLEPDVCEALLSLGREGRQDVVVAPIGFVSDHVEVLYDLDIAARAAATRAGLGFQRAGTAGDHPSFLLMLADLVRGAAWRGTVP